MKNFVSTLAVALLLMISESVFSSTPDAWLEFRKDVELKCESLAQSLFGETGVVSVDDYGTESYGVALIGAGGEASKSVAVCVYEKQTKKAHIAGHWNMACVADRDCTKQDLENVEGQFFQASRDTIEDIAKQSLEEGDGEPLGGQTGSSEATPTLAMIEQALPYAELSAQIYECPERCEAFAGKAGRWLPLLDSKEMFKEREQKKNETGPHTANSTPPTRVQVTDAPMGFHAAAFRNAKTDDLAIVYEGTTSIADWATNFAHANPFWTPSQYSAAVEFAQEVENRFCAAANDCRMRIVLTGHSLGGGLAQYAAIKLGRRAYTFNAAGLWDSTAGDLDTTIAANAKVVHFRSKGYKFGFRLGIDFVPYTGVQFAEQTIDVPIELPVWAWDTVTLEIITHNMDRLRDAMFALAEVDVGDLEDTTTSTPVASGAHCVRAKTSNLETECELCEPVSAGLYRPKELHQANFDGEEDHKYRYEWKGGCSRGSIDGLGTLTVYSDEVDFFELLASERSGVRFRSGAPIVTVPADDVDVRLSSGAVLATPGTCPNSDDLMIWVIVDGPLQTQSSSVAEKVLRFARKHAVENCPSLKGVRFELHVVQRQAIDDPGRSKESKVSTNPLERLRRKRNLSPQESGATCDVQKFITEWVGGTRYGDYVSCKGSKLALDSNCDRENYNTFVRTHAREMRQRHSAHVRAERERQQHATAEAQRRAQEANAAEAQQRLDAEVSLLTQRAERFLNEGIGTPAELATALQVDERRTLTRLERGVQLDVEPVEGIRTVGHGGKNYYGVTYHATSLIADAEKRQRDQQMKEKFSWGGWFDQISSVGSARKLELTCLFRTASDIPKERQRVGAKLISLNSVGKSISIAIECGAGALGYNRAGENFPGPEEAQVKNLEFEEQGDLSREQAAHLIQRERGLPQQTTISIGKSYAKRFQLVHKYTPGICRTYGGHQWDSDVKLLTTLEEKRLITLSKERKITENNCHRWWVDIGLTPEGRNYLVGESQQEYTFRTADISINEVTGLIFNEGKTMAIAEYNFKAVNVTPFAIEKVSVPKGRKETLLLYDDGWRIAK